MIDKLWQSTTTNVLSDFQKYLMVASCNLWLETVGEMHCIEIVYRNLKVLKQYLKFDYLLTQIKPVSDLIKLKINH